MVEPFDKTTQLHDSLHTEVGGPAPQGLSPSSHHYEELPTYLLVLGNGRVLPAVCTRSIGAKLELTHCFDAPFGKLDGYSARR